MPAVAQNEVVVPEQIVLSPVMLHVGFVYTVSVRLQVLWQPFASVTVSVYSPATLTSTHWAVELNPPGPLQLKV